MKLKFSIKVHLTSINKFYQYFQAQIILHSVQVYRFKYKLNASALEHYLLESKSLLLVFINLITKYFHAPVIL